MGRTFTILTIGVFTCFSLVWLRTADSESPIRQDVNSNTHPESKVQFSDKAVVKDVVYNLEEEENRLYLTSQSLESNDRTTQRIELKFTVPRGGQVQEMSLAKLDGKNLFAVVKLFCAGQYEFHCLTFIGSVNGARAKNHFAFHQAKFFTTREDLKILAIGGKHFSGSVYIVLGDMIASDDLEKMTTKGIFYFSGCPWPPSGGTISKFDVESVHPKVPAD